MKKSSFMYKTSQSPAASVLNVTKSKSLSKISYNFSTEVLLFMVHGLLEKSLKFYGSSFARLEKHL